jgi:hypothetical protein
MGGTVAAGATAASAAVGAADAAGAAGAAAGAMATVTPAPASCTLCSSAPALAFVRSSLSSPLALAFVRPSLSSPLTLAPALTLVRQAPLLLVWVPLFACLHAPVLCGGSLIVPVYKSKISYHNTLFALTFGI